MLLLLPRPAKSGHIDPAWERHRFQHPPILISQSFAAATALVTCISDKLPGDTSPLLFLRRIEFKGKER